MEAHAARRSHGAPRGWCCGMRAGEAGHQPRATGRAGQVVLRRREPRSDRGRPRVLHEEHGGRCWLRRSAGRSLYVHVRPAGLSDPLGDHRRLHQRPALVRAHRGQRRQGQPDRRAPPQVGQRRANRRELPHQVALPNPSRVQPDHGRRAERHRGERERSALERAAVLPRGLVAEPRDRRVRLRHAVDDGPLRRHQVLIARLHRARPVEPGRAPLRRQRRLLRRHQQSVRRAVAHRSVEPRLGHRHVPRVLSARRIRGRHVSVRQLQPGRDHAPPVVPQGRRQGLRAAGSRRLPVPVVRYLRDRAHRLRPQLRHDRRQVAPLREPLQHLGAQPLLQEPRHDGGPHRLRARH